MSGGWLAISTPAQTLERLEHDLHEVGAPIHEARAVYTHVLNRVDPHLVGSLHLGRVALGTIRAVEDECLSRRWSTFFRAGNVEHESGPGEGRAWAHVAIQVAMTGREGRAIRFRGQDAIPEECSVGEIVRRTDIDRVEGVGAAVDDRTVVVTHRFLRPTFSAGELVLHVTPLADGRFQPFESGTPYRCCAAA
jgi:hypothetical protein